MLERCLLQWKMPEIGLLWGHCRAQQDRFVTSQPRCGTCRTLQGLYSTDLFGILVVLHHGFKRKLLWHQAVPGGIMNSCSAGWGLLERVSDACHAIETTDSPWCFSPCMVTDAWKFWAWQYIQFTILQCQMCLGFGLQWTVLTFYLIFSHKFIFVPILHTLAFTTTEVLTTTGTSLSSSLKERDILTTGTFEPS